MFISIINYLYIYFQDAHTLDFSVLDTTANITTIRLFDYNTEYFKRAIRRWELVEFDFDPKRSMYHIEPKTVKVNKIYSYKFDLNISEMEPINSLRENIDIYMVEIATIIYL